MKRTAEFIPSAKRLHYWVTPTQRIARICESWADAKIFIQAHIIETEIVQELEIKGTTIR